MLKHLFHKCFLLIPTILMFRVVMVSAVTPGTICYNRVDILGASNINTFHFSYNFNKTETPQLVDTTTSVFVLKLTLTNFDFSNPFMKRDFLDLMKAQYYPHLLIEFSNIQTNESLESIQTNNVLITLAGVTKSEQVNCTITRCSKDFIILSGQHTINLKDYNILPQTYFGFIKIQNDNYINFEILIKYPNHEI